LFPGCPEKKGRPRSNKDGGRAKGGLFRTKKKSCLKGACRCSTTRRGGKKKRGLKPANLPNWDKKEKERARKTQKFEAGEIVGPTGN